MSSSLPVALTIAGADCSGGAGIQADLRVFDAHRVEGLSVITAIVVEDTRRVTRLEPLPVDLLRDQLDLLAQSYRIQALKTGLLPSAAHIELVADFVKKHPAPLVIDPVLSATAGGVIFSNEETQRLLLATLFPLATLLTPNFPEAQKIAQLSALNSLASPPELAQEIADKFQTAVLLKGGHLDENESTVTDFLAQPNKALITHQSLRHHEGESPHGTGCVLSAAITANLSKGKGLEEAVAQAKAYLAQAFTQQGSQPEQRPTLGR